MRAADSCLIGRRQPRCASLAGTAAPVFGYWHDRPCYALEIDEVEEVDPLQYQVGNLYQILTG